KIQKREPLRIEIEHFIQCVIKGEKPLVSGEEGLHALEVAVKALESAEKDKVIRVKNW
ncbi:gfo/Idh/MocA family oxidoreductase, partial [Thermococci archaeon]